MTLSSSSAQFPVRMAMVGGGPEAFIGPVHRMAAELDGRMRLVAGAFSAKSERALAGGRSYNIPEDRIYSDWREMIWVEATRADGAEIVAIVTPNHLHLPVALAALEVGMHVISDKPATATLDEAIALQAAVERSGRVYALTYTYTGYPMVRHAREMVLRGDIGAVRRIIVNYAQGWLSQPVEQQQNKQALWRTDPARSGLGGCIADIGIHAFNLAEYVSGQRVESIVADLASLGAGRLLDDDCNLLLRFENGQRGVLTASQIATGERNDLQIRISGTEGTIVWTHEEAGCLHLLRSDGSSHTFRAGSPGLADPGRLPTGHPEGFIEAFATIYSDVASAIRGTRGLIDVTVPGIQAGVRSMRLVERAVSASRSGAGWVSLEEPKREGDE